MIQRKNQVVLVTGCSTGIGRALASEFASRGHRTFASARRLETLAGLSDCELLSLDVTHQQSIADAVSRVMELAGRIDILVNNAGINRFGPLVEVPLEDVKQLCDTNVVGLLATTQAVFPHMAKQQSGRIVNLGSVVGVVPTPFAGCYCGTKSAVHTLSDVLRLEVAPFGIDVVVVQPGGVRSSIAKNGSVGLERYAAHASHYKQVYKHIVGRANLSQDNPMAADDFARVVVDAVTRHKAPRVVRAGTGSVVLPLLSRLPEPLIERILARRFGLAALTESIGNTRAHGDDDSGVGLDGQAVGG